GGGIATTAQISSVDKKVDELALKETRLQSEIDALRAAAASPATTWIAWEQDWAPMRPGAKEYIATSKWTAVTAAVDAGSCIAKVDLLIPSLGFTLAEVRSQDPWLAVSASRMVKIACLPEGTKPD
ncbi:MAG: hypothetical protein KGL35_10740, partial [Bradyrhizobium sp.]|nr:hypothetical protein [Bradyrhizobium sp.]